MIVISSLIEKELLSIFYQVETSTKQQKKMTGKYESKFLKGRFLQYLVADWQDTFMMMEVFHHHVVIGPFKWVIFYLLKDSLKQQENMTCAC